MLVKSLIVLGYYLVAITTVAVWTFRDFAATRARVSTTGFGADRLAGRFLARVSALFGLAAGVGAALLMELLMTPPPKVWIVAAITVGDLALTVLGVQLVIRLWPRVAGRDPLEELRPTGGLARDLEPRSPAGAGPEATDS